MDEEYELFRFLETDLSNAGNLDTVTEGHGSPIHVLQLAAELANDDWSEEEAGDELARQCTAEALHAAQTTLISALAANPVLDLLGIRMTRIIWKALGP